MKKSIALVIAVFMLMSVVVGCKSNTPATKKTGYNGTKLVFACLDTTIYRKLDNLIAPLKKATGIDLTIDYIPEADYMTKLQVVLSAGTGEYDAVYANNKMFGTLYASGWLQPLDAMMKDTTKTDADYNYADFIPKIAQACMYNGSIMGIPFAAESDILYYNKAMFTAAGLTTPPKTFEDVYNYAKILNKPDQGQAGIAMLGTAAGDVNSYGWIMLWLAMGGSWTPPGKQPYTVLADDVAIRATTMYSDMLMNYGPKGVANYGWNELYLAMQQKKVAMVIATTKDYPTFVDPTKSQIGSDLGYAALAGMGNDFTVGNIGSWSIPKSGKNINAAWKAVQYMTGKDAELVQVTQINDVSSVRQSVLGSSTFTSKYNKEWAAASTEAFAHGAVQYTPLIPQGGQIRDYLSIALAKVLSGQATPTQAMTEANNNVKTLLKTS
jgi:ABC-type glycerol-3-phosphate transport system substrate-binding protein